MSNDSQDASCPGTPNPPSYTPTTDACHSKARSPSASRLKKSLNGIVHRVKEVMSPTTESDPSRRGRSPDRRDATASTGRGGAGNMVSSKSRDRAFIAESKDLQAGDRFLKKNPALARSVGRGGAGNIRSPSRDLKKTPTEERFLKELEEEEKEIEASYADRQKIEPVHMGRGGAGNMIH